MINNNCSIYKSIFLPFIVLFFSLNAQAKVAMKLPFTSHMVLQRNMPVPIWGTAAAGEKVTLSFNGQIKDTVTATNGKWKIVLDPMIENGPLTMTVTGTNTLTFTDIYIGEVWNCAGQSNMDTRLSYYETNNPTWGYTDTIANATDSLLRYVDVRYSILNKNVGWHAISPTTASGCSATAYFFGKALQKKLGCAVGLLVTAVGGTFIEGWLDPETIAADTNMVMPNGLTTAGDQYNQFIVPVLNYGIKGTICMHGEQNAGDTLTAPLYGDRFKKLITSWRKDWGQGDFPFYYGQITQFNTTAPIDSFSPKVEVREGQRFALSLPQTAMTVNLDLGTGTWHFPNKYEAGRRLSIIAFAKDYGYDTLEYSGPVFEKMGVQGNKAKLLFSHRGSGMKLSSGTTLNGFYISGANGVWYKATGTIVDSMVVLTSTSVPNPTRVSYTQGKTTYNLYNKQGLPASPFNSDLQCWTDGINQIISMPETSTKTLGVPDFSPATTTSGLPITYQTDNPNVATIDSAGLIHLEGAGTCRIIAYQAGDTTYRSSVVLSQTLTVSYPLPITFLPLTVTKKNTLAMLHWATLAEQNNDYFEVQRSTDGSNFISITNLTSKGNSAAKIEYEFTDNAPLKGLNYYRIKQVDKSGKFTYGNVVSINFTTNNNTLKLYPNPAKEIVTFSFYAKEQGLFVANIINAKGVVVKAINLYATYGDNNKQINLAGLSKGNYTIVLKNNNQTISSRFEKL